MKIGLDVGSTTIKSIVLDGLGNIVYSAYERHFSQITAKTVEALEKIRARFPGKEETSLVISGSAGMGMAESCSIDFVQEVYATKVAAQENAPGTDVIIELGGEDAKIIYLQGAMEARMNGSCAGGTGAFIDQMATLLGITPDDMNDLAAESTKQYTIASRCGVFAKSDIQPLINQGADRRDISASIFSAVVNQTIGGLAQGRAIEGNVLYLGGPLTFMPELRKSFDKALRLEGTCPDNSLYYVALGAALCAKTAVDLDQVIARLSEYESVNDFDTLPPLFESEKEYQEFCARHAQADVTYGNLEGYTGQAWLGIDHRVCGGHRGGKGDSGQHLSVQQRQSGSHCAGLPDRDVPEESRDSAGRGLRHRLRGGYYPQCLFPGLRSGGDHGPLKGSPGVYAGCGVYY